MKRLNEYLSESKDLRWLENLVAASKNKLMKVKAIRKRDRKEMTLELFLDDTGLGVAGMPHADVEDFEFEKIKQQHEEI